jgi:hypothetical protein
MADQTRTGSTRTIVDSSSSDIGLFLAMTMDARGATACWPTWT